MSDVTALACITQLEGVDTGDFEAVNAAAFLLSTESSKTIFIAVKDDDLPEADETFTFNLTLQVCTPDACAVFYFAVLEMLQPGIIFSLSFSCLHSLVTGPTLSQFPDSSPDQVKP